jgi:hypothetical protein
MWRDGLARYVPQTPGTDAHHVPDDPNPIDEETYAVDAEGPLPMPGEAWESQLEQVELHDVKLPSDILCTAEEISKVYSSLRLDPGSCDDAHVDAFNVFRDTLLGFSKESRVIIIVRSNVTILGRPADDQ